MNQTFLLLPQSHCIHRVPSFCLDSITLIPLYLVYNQFCLCPNALVSLALSLLLQYHHIHRVPPFLSSIKLIFLSLVTNSFSLSVICNANTVRLAFSLLLQYHPFLRSKNLLSLPSVINFASVLLHYGASKVVQTFSCGYSATHSTECSHSASG